MSAAVAVAMIANTRIASRSTSEMPACNGIASCISITCRMSVRAAATAAPRAPAIGTRMRVAMAPMMAATRLSIATVRVWPCAASVMALNSKVALKR